MVRPVRLFLALAASANLTLAEVGLDAQRDNLVMLQFRADVKSLGEAESELQCRPYCGKHTSAWVAKCKWKTLDCSGCSDCLTVLRTVYDNVLTTGQLHDLVRREAQASNQSCTGNDCDLKVAGTPGAERRKELKLKQNALRRHDEFKENTTEGECQTWCKFEEDPWSAKCTWDSGSCSACPECTDLPKNCEMWCGYHTESWHTKCSWNRGECSACEECMMPHFVSVPDEYINPPCDPETENVNSLGTAGNARECKNLVEAAAAVDLNINYGVWRGDTNKECFTCMMHATRFAIDYIDKKGVVSFVKKDECQSWCAEAAYTWEEKCSWESRHCSGCTECATARCLSLTCPPCESWCPTNSNPWDLKCNYQSCRGCESCGELVQAGVFTMHNQLTGKYLAIEHQGLEPNGTLVQMSSAHPDDSRTQWRFVLNMTSGFYTCQNVYSEEFLTIVNDTNDAHGCEVSIVALRDDPSTQWITDLSGSREGRTFTMLGSVVGLYVASRENGTTLLGTTTLNPSVEWVFVPVDAGAVGTAYPTMAPTPGPPGSDPLDMTNSKLSTNNLGGAGPGSGDPEMRFKGVAGPGVDLVVTNITEYVPWNVTSNKQVGDNNAFGQLSLKCGQQVTLKFNFALSGTMEPVTMKLFTFTVADLDEGIYDKCTESIEVSGYQSYIVDPASTLHSIPEFGAAKFEATRGGDEEDNPLSLELSPEQSSKSVAFVFVDVQSFTLTFRTDTDESGHDPKAVGWAGRKILFTGETSLSNLAPIP